MKLSLVPLSKVMVVTRTRQRCLFFALFWPVQIALLKLKLKQIAPTSSMYGWVEINMSLMFCLRCLTNLCSHQVLLESGKDSASPKTTQPSSPARSRSPASNKINANGKWFDFEVKWELWEVSNCHPWTFPLSSYDHYSLALEASA